MMVMSLLPLTGLVIMMDVVIHGVGTLLGSIHHIIRGMILTGTGMIPGTMAIMVGTVAGIVHGIIAITGIVLTVGMVVILIIPPVLATYTVQEAT